MICWVACCSTTDLKRKYHNSYLIYFLCNRKVTLNFRSSPWSSPARITWGITWTRNTSVSIIHSNLVILMRREGGRRAGREGGGRGGRERWVNERQRGKEQERDKIERGGEGGMHSWCPTWLYYSLLVLSCFSLDFQASYKLDVPSLCTDFQEDIEFHFTLGWQAILRKFLAPHNAGLAIALGANVRTQTGTKTCARYIWC